MSRTKTVRIVEKDLLEHPAVQAWHELQSVYIVPERIEFLKGKLPLQTDRSKRLICRLVGVGPAGSTVIGKRSRRASAALENTIYKEIIPYLPILSLNYYGMIEEANGGFCWIFLEDAGDEVYSTLDKEHRALGAQWLGLIHTSATHVAALACLPDKGPNHYFERLQSSRDAILHLLPNLSLQINDLSPLDAILRQFDLLEANWAKVEEFCEGIPRTLVHGDFVARNLRVRNGPSGMTLLPFDWAEAGWGMPATDLMHVDLADYWLMVRGHWPWLDVHAIQGLALVGKIFRCLDAVYWELPSFRYEWLKQPYHNMSIYVSRLADAIRAAGLSGAVGSKG